MTGLQQSVARAMKPAATAALHTIAGRPAKYAASNGGDFWNFSAATRSDYLMKRFNSSKPTA